MSNDEEMKLELRQLLSRMTPAQVQEYDRRIMMPGRGPVVMRYRIRIAKFVLGQEERKPDATV
jgi:hypothetical protein